MSTGKEIAVFHSDDEKLNGLGMMMLQYMEQNIDEFDHKVKQGLRLRAKVTVEVEKGIASTVTFQGDKIQVENGVGDNPDLYLKGSYLLLSKVLTGQANPVLEVLQGNLKLMTLPKKPIMALMILQFLKIPSELLQEPHPTPWLQYIFIAGAVIGLIAILLWFLLQSSG